MSNIKWNNVGNIFAGIACTIFVYLLIGDLCFDLNSSWWLHIIGWACIFLEYVSFCIDSHKKKNR
jgi:hypothetical protein